MEAATTSVQVRYFCFLEDKTMNIDVPDLDDAGGIQRPPGPKGGLHSDEHGHASQDGRNGEFHKEKNKQKRFNFNNIFLRLRRKGLAHMIKVCRGVEERGTI